MTKTTENGQMVDKDNHELTLERVVDAIGLAETLNLLSIICYEKASHIRSNWQDEVLANRWSRAAKAVVQCCDRAAVQNVQAP